MTTAAIAQIVVYVVLLLAITKPMGLFMARLFQGERTFLHPLLRPLERLVYKLCGVREDAEQRWTQYAGSLLSFSVFSFLFAYILQRAQGHLPLNPQTRGIIDRGVLEALPDGAMVVNTDKIKPEEASDMIAAVATRKA